MILTEALLRLERNILVILNFKFVKGFSIFSNIFLPQIHPLGLVQS